LDDFLSLLNDSDSTMISLRRLRRSVRELRQRKKENDDETMDSFVQVHEALNSNKQ